jgi:hypothetical protein
MLVERGMITTEEFSAKTTEAKDALTYMTHTEPSIPVPVPTVLGAPKKKLPKPPKPLPKTSPPEPPK